MRLHLKKINKSVITIVAITGRESHRGYLELKNVHTLNGKFLADHIWIEINPTIRLSNYRKGDLLQIKGRVRKYDKGGHCFKGYYKEQESDFGLYRFRSCQNLTRLERRMVA